MEPELLQPSTGNIAEQLLTREAPTVESGRLRELLLDIFRFRPYVESITVSGELIQYIRDDVLSALAGIRRLSAANARGTMSPDEISQATGLTKATISRLVTEHRNYS